MSISKVINFGGGIIKSRMIKIAGLVLTASILAQTSIVGYATTDLSYSETVTSIVDTKNKNLIQENKENSGSIPVGIASAIGVNDSSDTYSLVYGKEIFDFGVVYKSSDNENSLNDRFSQLTEISTDELSNNAILEIDKQEKNVEQAGAVASKDAEHRMYACNTATIRVKANESSKSLGELKINEPIITIGKPVDGWYKVKISKDKRGFIKRELLSETKTVFPTFRSVPAQKGTLIGIESPDNSYTGTTVTLTDSDRDTLERLVMGEAGGEGYIGAALVAQCIRDTMVYKGASSVEQVRTGYGYSGSLSREPNETVKKACAYIFDQGGMAVKHKVFYFYAPALCTSTWHESQHFVVEHHGHRFFSNN